ncbi:MAG: hypothetical protein CMJ59_13050 [Planctomycetaceae bacterium]|nr:hypothetical protein [Planctomycetaceae bacterium]
MLRLAIRRRLCATTLCVAALCAAARVYADEQRPQPFQVDPQTVALFHFAAAEGAHTANAVEREPHGTLAGAAIWQPIDHPGGNRAFAGGLLLIDENASLTWPDSPSADLPGTYAIACSYRRTSPSRWSLH